MLSKNVDLNNTVILVTGAAGFVGANLVMSLLSEAEGTQIIGIDSVNDYYDVALKDYRLQQIDEMSKDNKNTWIFKKGNIADKAFIEEIFSTYKPRVVVNLAAQAGVRYSITNPAAPVTRITVLFKSTFFESICNPVIALLSMSVLLYLIIYQRQK